MAKKKETESQEAIKGGNSRINALLEQNEMLRSTVSQI